MKSTRLVLSALALLFLASLCAITAYAWCNPEALNCGSAVSRNLNQNPWHNDINTYNCTGATTWNGHSHVYRIYPPQNGPLRLYLDWTPTANPDEDIHLFVLYDCNRNHCIGHTADSLTIPDAEAGNDYWIIIEGRGSAANPRTYSLSVLCGDDPLAAELQAFDATAQPESIALNWSVASERNNDHFAVERDMDNADNWQSIARVEGRGTATSAASYSVEDRSVVSGHEYTYRLVAVDLDGTSSIMGVTDVNFRPGADATASDFRLLGNYPNPFNPSTTIRFEALQDAEAMLDVFALDGRRVATLVDGMIEAGYHEVTFDAATFGTGVYFARLSSYAGTQMIKMVLMK